MERHAQHRENCDRVRELFEGREALYLEGRGALRVRVEDIEPDVERHLIRARVVEIPTPGLHDIWFHRQASDTDVPLRWSITAGFRSDYTAGLWCMGYGGWHLYFDPDLLRMAVELARSFDSAEDGDIRSMRIFALRFDHLDEIHARHGPAIRIFPGATPRDSGVLGGTFSADSLVLGNDPHDSDADGCGR